MPFPRPILALVILVVLFSQADAKEKTLKHTISGLSSGGFMAAQMHVAHSKSIGGVAVLAGGPYGCSEGSISTALFRCMKTLVGGPDGATLFAKAIRLGEKGQIDPVSHLKDSKVVLVTGENDTTVYSSVVYENLSFYASIDRSRIKVIDDLPLGHAFPTKSKGNVCEKQSEPPWVSACGRDVAGEILQHFYGTLSKPTKVDLENFFSFEQPSGTAMDDRGVAYIPKNCQGTTDCPIHMALHGCQQGIDGDSGDFYFKNVGFNEWAESNNIVIVYPQAVSTYGNPKQCWDWWGYISSDYKTQTAPQISALKSILDQMAAGTLTLNKYKK